MPLFTMEEYFNHLRETIRGMYFGFPKEDVRADFFRKMSAIEKAKIIVDGFDNLYTDCLIRELPIDLYAELVKNVTFIRGELAGGRCLERLRNNMGLCVEIGEAVMDSVTVTELSEDDKAPIAIPETFPLTLPERIIDKEEEYENIRKFIAFRDASMCPPEEGKTPPESDLAKHFRREGSLQMAMLTVSHIVRLKEEYGIEELPSDIHEELKRTVDYLKEELAGGQRTEG